MATRKSTASKSGKAKKINANELEELVNEGKKIDVKKAEEIIAKNESVGNSPDGVESYKEEPDSSMESMDKVVESCSDLAAKREDAGDSQPMKENGEIELMLVIDDVDIDESKESPAELNAAKDNEAAVEGETGKEVVGEVTGKASGEEDVITFDKETCADIAGEDKGTTGEELLLEEQPIDDVITECLGDAAPKKEGKEKEAEPWYIARAKRLGDYYNY